MAPEINDVALTADTRQGYFGRYPEAVAQITRMHERVSQPKALIIGVSHFEEPIEYLAAARFVRPDTTPNLFVADIHGPDEYIGRLQSPHKFPIKARYEKTDLETVDESLRAAVIIPEIGPAIPGPQLMEDITTTIRNKYIHVSISRLANETYTAVGFEGNYDYISCQNVIFYTWHRREEMTHETPEEHNAKYKQMDIDLYSKILSQILQMTAKDGILALNHDTSRPEIFTAIAQASKDSNIPLKVLDKDKMIFQRCSSFSEAGNLTYEKKLEEE